MTNTTTLTHTHYSNNTIELNGQVLQPYDLIKHFDFTTGNVIKYLLRDSKEPDGSKVKDYKKAIWYLNALAEEVRFEYYENHAFISCKFGQSGYEHRFVRGTFGVHLQIPAWCTKYPILDTLFPKRSDEWSATERESTISYDAIINTIKRLEELCVTRTEQ